MVSSVQTNQSEHELEQPHDDWSLTTDQMVFMLQHHNQILAAYTADDLAALRALAATDEFQRIFGAMSFDEAYDRYETMLEDGRADSSMAS